MCKKKKSKKAIIFRFTEDNVQDYLLAGNSDFPFLESLLDATVPVGESQASCLPLFPLFTLS